MHAIVVAAALAVGQYGTPQAPTYGAPAPQYAAPLTYAIPTTYAAPQVVALGAGQVIPPSPFGLLLGHIGRKLEQHSWPRVQPMMATPVGVPAQQVMYISVAPQVAQAVYSVPAPTYQAPPPPPTYQAPAPPAKNPPSTYGSPQAPPPSTYGAAKPNESAPPVPNR